MSRAAAVRVLIAEDDGEVRAALADLINTEPQLELVGAAANTSEAIAFASTHKPDVILIDVRMPGGGGIVAARRIRRLSPDSKIIAFSGQGDRSTVLRMLEAGAVGYLLKGGPAGEITEAIERAAKGLSSLSSEVTGGIIEELAGQLSLSSRTRTRQRASERRIQRVLDDESMLSMAFQPIAGLHDGRTVGAEALARFSPAPQRAPNYWFAEAARVGLDTELELLAARRALEALPKLPPDTYLTFNVSPHTLATPRLARLIAGTDGTRLVAEITEHSPVHHYAKLASSIKKLRSLGLRLAIDDAGAGYSSLRHVLELRPHFIKLDMALIRNIHHDKSKQALATSLISFAKKSRASIIAEGIEHAEELNTLLRLGVDHGQGYYLGRPAPLPLQMQVGR